MTGARNEDTSFSVYGIAMITKKIEKCVNTGNLTIKNTAKGDAGFGLEFEACGVAGSCYGQAKGCGNTGKISVTNQGGKTSRAVVKVCGIEASAVKIKQCYNKGAVSFTGVCSGRDYEGDNEVAGVGFAASMSECYNTGKITVNTKKRIYQCWRCKLLWNEIKTVIIQERSALPEKVMQVVLSENSATEAAITT